MSKIILKKEINVLKDLLNNLDNFPKEKSPKGIGQLSKIKFSIIRYSLSNGKEVNVFLGEPKEKKIDKIPAIIFHTGAIPINRGTQEFNIEQIYKTANSKPNSSLVKILQEYAVFFIRYSDEVTGLVDSMGGEDLYSSIEIYDVMKELGNIDTDKIGVHGISRGVDTSLQLLKSVDWIKYMILKSGAYNFENSFNYRGNNWFPALLFSINLLDKKEIKKRSVINWVDELPKNTPLLIVNGTKDCRCDVGEARAFVEKYGKINPNIEYVEYDDDHFLKNYTKEYDDCFFKFLKKFK